MKDYVIITLLVLTLAGVAYNAYAIAKVDTITNNIGQYLVENL